MNRIKRIKTEEQRGGILDLSSVHHSVNIVHPDKKQISSSAFTLVEILVSMALVVILMTVVTQIMRNTQIATNSSRKHLDADDEARMVFDRMGSDFSHMLKRSDVDFIINKPTNNDSLFFYSEAPAFASANNIPISNQNSVSLIGYRINPKTTTNAYGQLERLGLELSWGTNDVYLSGANLGNPYPKVIFLTYTNTPVTTVNTTLNTNTAFASAFKTQVATNSTDANYQVIAPDVFRLEFCFLLKPWTDSGGTNHPASYSLLPYNTNSVYTNAIGRSDSANLLQNMITSKTYSNWGGVGLSDVQAILVTIAILDPTSRKMFPGGAPTSAQLAAMSGNLRDLVGDSTDIQATPPYLPAQQWQSSIDNGIYANALSTNSIPRAVSEQVRIYQRIFPLNTPNY